MGRRYNSVEEMVDDTASPEFAAEFRRHMRKPSVRLRTAWFLFCVRVRVWFDKLRERLGV